MIKFTPRYINNKKKIKRGRKQRKGKEIGLKRESDEIMDDEDWAFMKKHQINTNLHNERNQQFENYIANRFNPSKLTLQMST